MIKNSKSLMDKARNIANKHSYSKDIKYEDLIHRIKENLLWNKLITTTAIDSGSELEVLRW